MNTSNVSDFSGEQPNSELRPINLKIKSNKGYTLSASNESLFFWGAQEQYSNGLFGMVYKYFSRCFISKDSSPGFLELF